MEKNEDFVYAVKIGRNPGIYHTKEEMLEQVVQFTGALVGKFKDIDKAKMFMCSPTKEFKKTLSKEEKEKNREARIKRNKSLKLKLSGDVICFIDCEADKNIAVSLGAVIVDNKTDSIIDTFYSTIRPSNFVKLDKFTKKLTGLTDKEIFDSPSFDEVYQEFSAQLERYGVCDIFSWGKSDKQFLKKCNQKSTKLINSIKSIQTIISMVTADIIYNEQWSLKNIKTFLDIPSEVKHNALSDALDLCNVYTRWKNREINIDSLVAYNNDLKKSNDASNVIDEAKRVS